MWTTRIITAAVIVLGFFFFRDFVKDWTVSPGNVARGSAFADGASTDSAWVVENANRTEMLFRLKSIGPVERLRMYRVGVNSKKCERSPSGFINTRHTATLVVAYGSPLTEKEVQFLTWGGRIEDWLDESSQSVSLELGRS